mmetsp:Transcript_25069/g.72355  ORF Transcript_25069/g.72355 Transcript_25069/m.72355 type:complete len:109 (-) Transcript_25069:1505-1831(-)
MHPWHMHGMQHASKRQPIRASIDMHTVTHHISPHSSNRWAHKGAAQGMDVCVDDEQTNTSTQPSPSATTRPLSPLHTRTPADRMQPGPANPFAPTHVRKKKHTHKQVR